MPFSISETIKKVIHYRRSGETLYKEHAETDGSMVLLTAQNGVTGANAQAEFEAIRTALGTINSTLAGQTKMTVVADITARDALTGMNVGDQCWVLDASDDDTVASGAAKYIYQDTTNGWVKTAEAESMDMVVSWADVQNKEADVVHTGSSTTPASMPSGLADGGLLVVDVA